MATKKGSTPFKKGLTSLSERVGSGKFLSISPDESVTIAPLTNSADMISAEMHEFWEVNPLVSMPCLGPGCPACLTKNKPKFKAFLQVINQDKQVKIFSFGISIARQLEEIEESLGEIKGHVLRIKRNGSGLKTRYVVTPLGKKISVSGVDLYDVESELGPITVEDQTRVLRERDLLAESDIPATKKSKAKPVIVDEEEEFDDEEVSGFDDL